MTTDDFDYVRHFVRNQAAIVLEPGKEYLVESRLTTLARAERFRSVDELVREMRIHPNSELHLKVIDAMTTNETSFFRDIHPFEMLKKTLLPDLMARNGAKRELAFWCGAASTGQEPYSVMMTIAEHFPQLLRWDFKFVATDLSPTVLARAKAGRYSQLEVNRGMSPALLAKYFLPHETQWEFRVDMRKLVDFRELNLVKEWPSMPQMDVIFLRNVLIYFDLEIKKSILAKVRRQLRPGGYLLLGGAETTFNVDDAFERVPCDKTVLYRLK